jgi:hypothetical protein
MEARTGDPGLKSLYSLSRAVSPKNFISFIVNPRLDLAQSGEGHGGAVAFTQALLDELRPRMSGDEVRAGRRNRRRSSGGFRPSAWRSSRNLVRG